MKIERLLFLIYSLVLFIILILPIECIAFDSLPSANKINENDPSFTVNYILSSIESEDSLSESDKENLLIKADSIAKANSLKKYYGDILIKQGDVSYSKGIFSKAMVEFMAAIEAMENINDDNGIAIAYNKLGNVYVSQADFPIAMEYYIKSLNIKDSVGDSKGMANTYSNIGNALFQMYDTEQALDYYMKSIEIDKANGNEIGMAKTLMNVGMVNVEVFNYEEAIRYFEESIQIHLSSNNKLEIANCYTNMALVYMETNNNNKALDYFKKSLELYSEFGAEQGMASVYSNMGFFFSMNENYAEAIDYLKKGIRIAQKINSIQDIERTAQALSDAYQRVGNYKEAFNYFVLYKNMYDKLNNENNSRQFTQMEMNYDFEQQRKEIEFQQHKKEVEHKAEIKRQQMLLIFIVLGTLALLIFAIFIYRSYKRKQRDNEVLTRQKEAIEKQSIKINKQHKDITASIQYAKRIQTALLPPDSLLDSLLLDYFVLYKPRDIVSGDYYWITEKNSKIALVVADCTGHGVPGAFMSMLGISFLNEIIQQIDELGSSVILNKLREYIIKSLRQSNEIGENKDGMDLAMIVIDRDLKTVQYSGAYNPLILIRNGELIQYKADKMPIGISDKAGISFSDVKIPYETGDTIYMFSDGYVDQFGGPKNAKFKSRPFKNLLLEIQNKSMTEQLAILDTTIEEWKQDYEQIDDIIVSGIRL